MVVGIRHREYVTFFRGQVVSVAFEYQFPPFLVHEVDTCKFLLHPPALLPDLRLAFWLLLTIASHLVTACANPYRISLSFCEFLFFCSLSSLFSQQFVAMVRQREISITAITNFVFSFVYASPSCQISSTLPFFLWK